MGKSDFTVVETPTQHPQKVSQRVAHGACNMAKGGAGYAACKHWKKTVSEDVRKKRLHTRIAPANRTTDPSLRGHLVVS